MRRHQRPAVRAAYLIIRDGEEAQDVAQDAFVKAYQALDRFDPDRSFQPWLLQIVRNEARNRLRGNRRRRRLALRALDPAGTDPAETATWAAMRDDLAVGLERLAERHREILMLRYLLDLSEQETAEVLGVARGTVKSRTARALAELRGVLTVRGAADG